MEFMILGPLEARVGGASVPLGPEKQRALLAVLLLDANRTVSVSRLVDQLWGDEPPETAVKVIQTHVSRLRKVLPDGVLVTRAPGYQLRIEPGQLDLERFQRLCEQGRGALEEGEPESAAEMLGDALSLWRGPALAEFTSEPFGFDEGARLDELRLAAVEERIEAELALGRCGELVGELQSLVAAHPLRERPRCQLMLALYQAGRQADALAVYANARRTLVEQLGIEPGRVLQYLERAILRHDPSLEPAARPRSPGRSAPTMNPGAAADLGPFVGREPELGRLRADLNSTLSGHGRLVLLAGEPGIGKTRTALELAREAAGRGARVLWGRCYEREGAPPYWPWLQAIRAYVESCDPERLRSELGIGAAAVAEVVPEVRERVADLGPAAPLPDEKQARFRLLDSLASFLKRAAADEPLVIVLEDLDAADAGSLGLLEFVVHELADAPLLLVGTYRDVDLRRGHPLTQTLAELMRERLVARLPLRGLTEQDVAIFVADAVGAQPPAELVATVYHRTEGNPLFMNEFVELLTREGRLLPETILAQRDWGAGVPEGLREVIGRRLDRLSGRCNEVLQLASVVGREFSLEQLARLLDSSEEELVGAAEEALAAHVVEELPGAAGSYRFTHALFQETLAGELSTTRRVRLHARIATALEELYGERAVTHSAELAYHFAEAETVLGPEKLIHYSRLAGEEAFAAHAYDDAIAHFQRALAAREGEPLDDETAELLVALVRSEFLGRQRYDLGEALDRLREAFDYYAGRGDMRAAVELAAHPIPLVYGPTGVPQLLVRALDLVAPDSLDAGRILANAGWFVGTNDGDYEGAGHAFERALDIAERYRDAALERRILIQSARVDWWHLQLDSSVAKSTRALELARDADDQQTELYARAWLVREAAIRGNSGEARVHAVVALELAERLRERYWLATARVNEFWLANVVGDWDAARRESDAGLRYQPRDARNLGLRALLEYELRGGAEGETYLERLLEGMRATVPGATVGHTEVALVMAFVSVITAVLSRFDEAEAAARTVLDSPIRFPIFELYARVGLAVTAVGQADETAARELYRALATQSGNLLILIGMAADRLLGLLSVVMGELDAACAHFEAALDFTQRAGYRPEYARTAIDYASALRDRARPRDAERAAGLRDEGLGIARELEVHALEERALARRTAGGS